jgi:hypothetical protein
MPHHVVVGYDELEKLGLPVKKNGLADCEAFEIAKILNLFKFDFIMTGYMVFFLLKYKKTKNKTKFCDYDCDSSDNRCDNSYLL